MQNSLNYEDQKQKRAQSTAKIVYAKNPKVIRIDQNLYRPEYQPINFSQRFENQEYRQINMPSRYNDIQNLSQNNLKSSFVEKQVNLSVPYNKEHNSNSFEDKNVIYGQNSQYSLELLRKFEELQKNLLQNPQILQKTQQLLQGEDNSIYKSKSNINYINQINDLEDQVQLLTQQNQKYLQQVDEQSQNIELLQNSIQQKDQQISNYQQELEEQQEVRDKVEEDKFIIEKLEAERDFHHKSHIELRKQINNKANQDFQVGQLQRELHYMSEQQADYQERIQDLEEQIKELLIFAEKPRNEKQNTYEQFYAKKIVDLENTIKKLTEENFELQNFNKLESIDVNAGFQSVQFEVGNEKQVNILKKKILNQKQQIENLQSQVNQQNGENQNEKHYNQPSDSKLRLKLKKLEEQNNNLKQENINLKLQLKEKEQDIIAINNNKFQNNGLKEQNEKLLNINKRLNNEIKMLEQQLRRFERFKKDQFYFLRNQNNQFKFCLFQTQIIKICFYCLLIIILFYQLL